MRLHEKLAWPVTADGEDASSAIATTSETRLTADAMQDRRIDERLNSGGYEFTVGVRGRVRVPL